MLTVLHSVDEVIGNWNSSVSSEVNSNLYDRLSSDFILRHVKVEEVVFSIFHYLINDILFHSAVAFVNEFHEALAKLDNPCLWLVLIELSNLFLQVLTNIITKQTLNPKLAVSTTETDKVAFFHCTTLTEATIRGIKADFVEALVGSTNRHLDSEQQDNRRIGKSADTINSIAYMLCILYGIARVVHVRQFCCAEVELCVAGEFQQNTV